MIHLLTLGTALAQPAGFYHPEDIAPLSTAFVEASETLSTLSDERSRTLRQLAVALQRYREGLDLLGDQAPLGEIERLAELERTYHRQEAVLQTFADVLVEDFSGAMVAAMDTAAAVHGETQRCVGQIAEGPRVPGMPGRTKANPECVGEDLNASIAAAMDADTDLAAVIDEVMGRTWPEVEVTAEAQAPVGENAERWLSVRDLLFAGARDSLLGLERADDERRTEVEAALEGDTPDVGALADLVAEIEAETARARAEFAAPLLAVAVDRMARWKKEPATGWCANPRFLGGCTGEDASGVLVQRLLEDKKFVRALP